MALPAQHAEGSPEQRISKLGIKLPPFPKAAVPQYVPYSLVGDLLFISGQLPVREEDGSLHLGKVSHNPREEAGEVDVAAGRAAAHACALNLLSVMKEAAGSLDKVVRVVKLLAMVNCQGDFKEPQSVANGCSEVLIDVFGDAGRSARSAVGHAALPFGVPVEVEAIVQIEPNSKL